MGETSWTRAPQGLIDLFDECLPPDPLVERRRMFGYPAVFVRGNMAAGLFGERIFARLADADRAALPGGGDYFEPMPGRPMRAYAVIPEDVVADDETLAEVLAKAVAFTAAPPPKERKAKKARS